MTVKSEAEVRGSGDGGDEDGRGKEEADGEFFWQAIVCGMDVDEEEVGEEQGGEDGIEAQGCGIEDYGRCRHK